MNKYQQILTNTYQQYQQNNKYQQTINKYEQHINKYQQQI